MLKLSNFRCYLTFNAGLLFFFLLTSTVSLSAQIQPYPALSGKRVAELDYLKATSPDPLVNHRWENPKATDGLEIYTIRPMSWTSTDPASADFSALISDNTITVMGKGKLKFDFGQVNAGWLEFESDDLTDSITMSISEYNEPAIVNAGAVHPVKTSSPKKNGNTYRLELNPELYEGVRFGWINIMTHTKKWHIRNLRLVCQIKPSNYAGSFISSDEELNKIWYTGAYTVKLNLQNDYFGAILMERSDRHSWTGDAYPSQAASMVAFGNYDFVKKNITNTANLYNGIPSYALYWVLSLVDYVNYTGDTDFAKGYIKNASLKLDSAISYYGKSPKLGFYGWDERLGAGFENPNIQESQYAYSMLSIRSCMEFGQLMGKIGEKGLEKKYIDFAGAKIKDERTRKDWTEKFGLHAAADAVNTGLTTPSENSAFFKKNFTDRVNRLSYSPFNEYFIITALAKMNKQQEAISSIKDLWGGQLKYGGTTFFEVYRPSWNDILGVNDAPPNNQCGYTSLTHPWSAGVVKWLSEEVLGIKPVEPGFKVFDIVPQTGNLLTYVKGTTPTLKGDISADFNISQGIASISIPNGSVARRVAFPINGGEVKEVYINGKLVWNGKAIKSNGPVKITVDKHFVNFLQMSSGKYQLKLVREGKFQPAAPQESAWIYPVNNFRQDSITGGNWKSKYGKEGYMLFNYFGKGMHKMQLPDYLSSVKVRNEKDVHLRLTSTNRNTLGDTSSVGAIITQDPRPTQQSITLDLAVRDKMEHQVAIYFLDWDKKDRRSAIEVFDMESLNMLSPVQVIDNFENGKYLVFRYTKSIRIRINQVRGVNAAVSGIFMDK